MQSPLISIVITAYNYGHTLAEAVESACAQDYPHIEVVVLDNASTDGTASVMQGFAGHPRVRYIRNPENIGSIANHNKGITESRGAYITFLSADDRMDHRLIRTTYEHAAAHPEVDVVFTEIHLMDERGRIMHRRESMFGAGYNGLAHQLAYFLTFGPYAAFESMLIPRWVFTRYGPKDLSFVGSDYELMVRWAARGVRFAYIPQPLLDFRVHANQDSGSRNFYSGGAIASELIRIADMYVTPENSSLIRGFENGIMRHARAKREAVVQAGFVDDGELERSTEALCSRISSIRERNALEPFKPLLSIVLLADDRQQDLAQSLQSLVRQTVAPDEIILLHAAGMTPHIPSELRSRVLVAELPLPTAQGRALNTGARLAAGNCLAFLRAGNAFTEDHIAELLRVFSAQDVLVAFSGADVEVVEEGAATHGVYEAADDPNWMIVAPPCELEGLALRREAIDLSGGFRADMVSFAAWDLAIRLRARVKSGRTMSKSILREKVGVPSIYDDAGTSIGTIEHIYARFPIRDERFARLREIYLRELRQWLNSSRRQTTSEEGHVHTYRLIAGQALQHKQLALSGA